MNKEIFKGKVFSVEQVEVEINGHPVKRDLVVHHGGIAIVALLDHRIALVRQTRTGAGCKTLEIPAGTLEPGEQARECAIRELNEECKMECKDIRFMCKFWPTPGYCTEVIQIWQAFDLYKSDNPLDYDEGEDIELIWMDLNEAWDLVQKGEIMDGKTIIAIQNLLLREKGN